jgi:hypothetical protein
MTRFDGQQRLTTLFLFHPLILQRPDAPERQLDRSYAVKAWSTPPSGVGTSANARTEQALPPRS